MKELFPVRDHEIKTGDTERPERSSDRWLAYLPLIVAIGSVLCFAFGLCTGAVGTAWLFRDHEHRIARLEADSTIYRDVVVMLKAKGIVR